MFRSLPVRTISGNRLLQEAVPQFGGTFPNQSWMSRDGSIVIASPDEDGNLLTMNPVSGDIIQTWTVVGGVGNMRLSADGSKVAICQPTFQVGGASAGRVLIYDPRTGSLLRTINNPRVGTTYNDFFGFDCAISDDGNFIVINAPRYSNLPTNTNYYSRAFLFNLKTGALVYTYLDPAGAVAPASQTLFSTRVGISSDGSRVAISSANRPISTRFGYVYVYDQAGSTILLKANPSAAAYEKFGEQIALSSDGKRLLVTTSDFNTGFWYVTSFDVDTGSQVASYTFTSLAYTQFGIALDISSDGSTVGIVNKNGTNSYAQMRLFLYRHDATTPFKTIISPNSLGDYYFNFDQSGSVVQYSNNDAYNYSGNGGVSIEII